MFAVFIGIIVSFNIIIIVHKWNKGHRGNAIFDAMILVALSIVFSGSVEALTMGTVASACLSIYLMVFPKAISISFLEPKTKRYRKRRRAY